MKILIVDDERDFSDELSKFLKSLDYQVVNAYSGQEATEILQRDKPDVLISDLRLSGSGILDGDSILESLKSISPDTVPIVVTGCTAERVRKRLAELGALRYLIKPIDLAEIEKILTEVKNSK